MKERTYVEHTHDGISLRDWGGDIHPEEAKAYITYARMRLGSNITRVDAWPKGHQVRLYFHLAGPLFETIDRIYGGQS